MENRRIENAPNEGINLQADALADLPVTDEQADETKAGTGEASTLAVSLDTWRVG